MAVIHNTTLTPGKLDLLDRWLPEQPWFAAAVGGGIARAGGFRLDDPDGEVGIEFMIVTVGDDAAYLVPMTYRGTPLGGDDALIGTAEHGVLGTRWIYDGERDPVLRTQLAALLRGEVEPQSQRKSDTPDPTVHVKPATGAGSVHTNRVLSANGTPPGRGAYLSATWQRREGAIVRGIVATAD